MECRLNDKNVKAILINIFGGIVRCDRVANGVVQAVKELGLTVPVIVRLEGTNADIAKDILNNSGVKIIPASNLEDAAKKSVEIKPNALGFALMGRAQEILDDSNAALKNYKKAIELNPNIELANKYLAQRLPNKEAIKIYEKLTKDYPKNNKYFYESALRKLDDGDINGSLEDLENGLKIYLSLPKNYCQQKMSQ